MVQRGVKHQKVHTEDSLEQKSFLFNSFTYTMQFSTFRSHTHTHTHTEPTQTLVRRSVSWLTILSLTVH